MLSNMKTARRVRIDVTPQRHGVTLKRPQRAGKTVRTCWNVQRNVRMFATAQGNLRNGKRRPWEVGTRWETHTMTDWQPPRSRVERLALALAWSADDPDADHPAWVTATLHASRVPGWIDGTDGPAPAREPEPVKAPQLELDVFAATPMEAEPTPEEALATALELLAEAVRRKGALPTLDDCHRKRYGLPGVGAFTAAGGWHQVVVRFRAQAEGVA